MYNKNRMWNTLKYDLVLRQFEQAVEYATMSLIHQDTHVKFSKIYMLEFGR